MVTSISQISPAVSRINAAPKRNKPNIGTMMEEIILR